MASLRALLKRGLATVVPAGIVIWLFFKLYEMFDTLAKPLANVVVNYLPLPHVVADLMIMAGIIVVLALIGGLVMTRIGRQLQTHFERVFRITGPIYKVVKEAVESLFATGSHMVYKVVVVPFWDGRVYTFRIGYLVGDPSTIRAVEAGDGGAIVTVYFSHAPTPTTGNNMMRRLGDVILTDMATTSLMRCNAMLGAGANGELAPCIRTWLDCRGVSDTAPAPSPGAA